MSTEMWENTQLLSQSMPLTLGELRNQQQLSPKWTQGSFALEQTVQDETLCNESWPEPSSHCQL